MAPTLLYVMTWRLVSAVGLAAGAAGLGVPQSAPPLQRFEFAEPHMGTEFRVVLYAPDSAGAAYAARAAYAKVARLDSILSHYRAGSELSRLSATSGGEVAEPISGELWAVLAEALVWSERTGGAFDPTVGPLTRLWRWSSRREALPDPQRLARALGLVGREFLVLDRAGRSAHLTKVGMALDLGGIGKGYAADAALEVLEYEGVASALVDAGGDIVVGAPPPGQPGWVVDLPSGRRHLLAHSAVATSGDRFRYFEVDGVRYSHIVDPWTGLGTTGSRTSTVLAPDASTADVLASALLVLDASAARALIGSLDGVAAFIIGPDGGTLGNFPGPGHAPSQGIAGSRSPSQRWNQADTDPVNHTIN